MALPSTRDRSLLRDLGAVLLAIAIAAAIAALVFLAARARGLGSRSVPARAAKGILTSSRAWASGGPAVPGARPLRAGEIVAGEVSGALGRLVPEEIMRTSTVAPSPSEPMLRLVRTRIEGSWEGRRAEIEDRRTNDLRSYAIGDLLPYGSLLVGISTGAAEIMVADSHLVRLRDDGSVTELQNLALPPPPRPLSPARDLEPDYEESIRIALVDLRSGDRAVVQASIDELIAAGDPAIELLILHVESPIPVREAEYEFPSGSGVELRPRFAGEIVMLVLERITGQTFGALGKEGLTDAERGEISSAWKRWWGGE